ncbi:MULTISPECIES: phage tail tape measure protein [unclassified Serratia (in: enterobacteria)]|uniref:phage tail tape measure protein n=1 Tax=unclassified Serratia (in: enterobacteria) TaxID=2647522 RepID=UPI0004686378|nr:MULTISPECIES: phage tail tape measure protein [unclassified Serratia (in: enterobacteria)]
MSNNVKLQVLLKAVDQASRPFKHIQTASKTLSANIRATQQDLKKLNAQARRIEVFRESSAQLAVTSKALKKAKQEAAALAIALKSTVNPTNAQVKAMEAAKRAASELQLKHNGLRQSVHRQRQELAQAGINTRTLANDERRLRTSISDTTGQLNRQREALARVSQQQARLSNVQRRYQTGKQLAGNVAGMGAAGVGIATTGLYAAGRFIAPGVGFDKQMSATQSILDVDKSDEKLVKIRQQARDIGGSTAFSPMDVARTQTTLAKSGYDADAVLAATGSTVNLSLAADVDIAQAADIITNMQSAFNLPMSEIERVADVMTKGFTSSNTNLVELGEAMKYAAPIAEAAGASIEDTTAMLGILADNGIKASMAGTGTSAIFSRLQAPRGQSPAALGELGVKTRDGKGNMLPVEKILKSIHASFKKNKLGTAQQAEYLKVIFGEEAMKGAVKLVAAAGSGKLAEKRAAIAGSKGTTDKVAKVQTDNLDGDLKNLQSAWEDLQIEVFEKQDSALRKLTRTTTEWLATIGKWAKENPELTKKIFTFTTAILAAIGALGGIGLVAWPVISGINTIIAAAGLLSTVFSAAGGAIMAVLGAITWPVVAVAAAFVAGALLIRKYWEPISAFFGGVIIGISEAFAPIAELFTPLKPMFDALGGWLKQAWQWFTDLLKPVKSSQESLDSCKNAGVEFGRRLADALMLPLKAFNKLREGIKWVLEKLGVINSESSDIDKKAQKANDYAAGASGGGYYPVGGAMPGAYVPVSAGGGRAYTDNSVNNFHVSSSHPGGMTEAETKRMLLQVVEDRERKARAAQRSTLASD